MKSFTSTPERTSAPLRRNQPHDVVACRTLFGRWTAERADPGPDRRAPRERPIEHVGIRDICHTERLTIERSHAPVLVIDASEIGRQCLRELLAAAGFSVRELATPHGATRVARELGARAVVIDQDLPALDGPKLAALFRADPTLRHVRLVLIASEDVAGQSALMRQGCADACVSKSRMSGELVATVKRLLGDS